MTTRRRRVLAVSALKGGVGKTTTAMNLAAAAARAGRRTLLVDADPQGSVGMSLGLAPEARGLAAWVTKDASFDDSVVRAARENLDVLPAGERLLDVEDGFRGKGREKRRSRVQKGFGGVRQKGGGKTPGPASKSVSRRSTRKGTRSSSSTVRPRLRFSSRTCTTSRTSSSCPRRSTFSRSR